MASSDKAVETVAAPIEVCISSLPCYARVVDTTYNDEVSVE